MNDKGNEGEKVKHCPMINEYCIMDRCALYTEMMRQTGGLQQKFGMCSFSAVVMILSEMNMKAQTQQEQVSIPNLYRG
ncbi:hypothetical protein LCGC14_2462040 [marine sediment metagenome]|uniref:Uncharacterized protein n=1 Tax=marine sediment metagenome TaxID=412755 RepID=A0A0F9DQ42_9ZZZZ